MRYVGAIPYHKITKALGEKCESNHYAHHLGRILYWDRSLDAIANGSPLRLNFHTPTGQKIFFPTVRNYQTKFSITMGTQDLIECAYVMVCI